MTLTKQYDIDDLLYLSKYDRLGDRQGKFPLVRDLAYGIFRSPVNDDKRDTNDNELIELQINFVCRRHRGLDPLWYAGLFSVVLQGILQILAPDVLLPLVQMDRRYYQLDFRTTSTPIRKGVYKHVLLAYALFLSEVTRKDVFTEHY